MKLLLSNDDGVTSPGLHALAGALCGAHEVCVAAPANQQSAVSRAMTLFNPLRADETVLPGLSGVPAFAVTGTPVDCVRLGIGNLFPRPDMVLSGINIGANLGTDVLYSGTVAAAHEAALLGIQAIAMSCCSFQPAHLETAGRVAAWAVGYLQAHPLPFGTLLNVNVPDVPFEALRGVRTASLCVEEYALRFCEREDPRGRKYYWAPRERLTCVADGADVDERFVAEGYAVLTPLTYDLTDRTVLSGMDLAFEGMAGWKAY